MKRRNFIKKASAGSVAAMVLPNLISGKTISQNENHKPIRTSNDEYLEKYSSNGAVRSGVALGGIGTGSIELRKDGKFYNWSIFNNYPKGTGNKFIQTPGEHEDPSASNLFFIVRYEVAGETPKMKLLQISDGLNEGGMDGITYYFPWIEAVESIEYKARFPFVNMKFSDSNMPFDIDLEAYSPFIPHDVKNSSLPLNNFDFKITSKTNKKVDVMIIASLRNLVGYDVSEKYFETEIAKTKKYVASSMSCGGMDKGESSFGEMVLTSVNPKSTYYTGWEHRHPYYEYVIRNKKLPNIDDTDGTSGMANIPNWLPQTDGRNKTDKVTGKKSVSNSEDPRLFSSVAYSSELTKTSKSFKHSFIFSWNFPNNYAEKKDNSISDVIEGHYYSNFFNTGLEVTEYGVENKKILLDKSKKFLNDFFDSSLPTFVLEQINSQHNTFITSGRLVKNGSFGVQEGLAPSKSWGPMATIDVALYGSIPTLALFPELQKSTMRAHKNIQKENGQIAHGLYKNFSEFEDNTADVSDRVDLPSQYIIMVLRDYFWTNDKEYLKEMWPSIKKAMDYIFNNLDLNKDLMPNMEGARSSYDNFPMFGLASYIQSQWLCAMASVNKASTDMGDIELKKLSNKVLKLGSKLMDEHLWNGEYYRLYNDYDGVMKADKKIDDGCLTDQIIGQWAANQSGLGYLFDKKHVNKSLKNIFKHSFVNGGGLKNATWPDEKALAEIPKNLWVDQGNTYWTGVELGFASFLIDEGMYDEGLKVIKAVDDRHRKAGLYWNHQEFGGHYYRPMSAWAILNSVAGLRINGNVIYLSPKMKGNKTKLFIATAKGTSHILKNGNQLMLKQLSGNLSFKQLIVSELNFTSKNISIRLNGVLQNTKIEKFGNEIKVLFDSDVKLNSGETISILG